VPHDILGDAPKQESADATPSVRPDDDHVRALGNGGVDDRLAGLALPDEGSDWHAGAPATGDECTCRQLALLSDLVHSGREAATRKAQQSCVDDADDEEPGVQPGRQPDRAVDSRLGRRSQIRRDEDRAQVGGARRGRDSVVR